MATTYDKEFFSFVADDSLRSARVVVPIIMQLLSPKSVLDIGCGPGAWLRAFVENGVSQIQGIDGDYIDRERLLIEPQYFIAADLTKPIVLNPEYDLVVCIEVAEHLPSANANGLVEKLACAAPAILFSAAIPGQGGTNHLNEQWLGYWCNRFSEQGFMMVDAIRPRIRDDLRIAFYIRQNLVLFLSDRILASRPTLRHLAEKECDVDTEWVHADLYRKWLNRATTELGAKEILSRLPAAFYRAVGRRMKRSRAFRGKLCSTKPIHKTIRRNDPASL
jgi:SAM-dependent methyltransferase